MMKIHVLVEISVAENVADIYPNYHLNYDDEEQFINSLIDGIETPNEHEGVSFDNLKKYGYSIRVLTVEETKLMEIIKEKEL